MILVFDLDNTLYDERAYVHGGFRAVARYMSRKYHKDPGIVFKKLSDVEKSRGRGNVFDAVLHEIGIRSKNIVRECVRVYRAHDPGIRLRQDADSCLRRFKHLPLYIVTDGNKFVQRKKIEALNLGERVVQSYITHQYGLAKAKPSPYCLLRICRREHVAPGEVVYIGDNPLKDFVGIKPLGFRTIRLLQGPHRATKVRPSHDADITIRSLNQVTVRLLDRLLHG